MTKDEAKRKILELVEKYEKVKLSRSITKYTEEETKKGFIEPLFEALGWDLRNKDEVSAEESLSSGRPDYGFYLDGRLKFYLEAKPLKSDLHRVELADQAVRYSWNKGATWAILTDFESLKVFNAQVIDRSLSDKLFYEIPYSKYLERFDQLWLLSKESFKENLLDKDAEAHGKKLQRISVTDKLYKDLNQCREILTHHLEQWNKDVDKDLLDEGVQKLLDRLIFLRVAEDRGIEPPTLIPLIRDWENRDGKQHLYESMIKKFREFDEIYNSNLFSEHPFEKWEEYSGATEKAIKILYGKPGYYEYDFKAMPADVLGGVYENYLGYRLEKSRKGLSVSKDAKKRKEHGIYYTPDFIVDYIVKNTLQPVLDKCKSIEDLKKIKVLDPACGSGSFLIKALEVIHNKYVEFGSRGDVWTKIDILLNNIYGVDLDPQAVEIARLNLLINALDTRMKLPSLANNIKKGNSLISDKKVSSDAFDWKEEFSEVFKQGGFDVIITNPPYIKEFVNKNAFDGLRSSPYYQGKMDLWTLFACISIDLLKEDGIMGFIAPNNWVSNAGASILRNKILKEGELRTFIDFGDYKVFDQAGIQTMIFVFDKKTPNKKYFVEYLKVNDKNIGEDQLIANIFGQKTDIQIEPERLINKSLTFPVPESASIFDKLDEKKNFQLIEKEVGQGIVAAPDKYFLENDISGYNNDELMFLKPYFTASGRYRSGKSKAYIFYLSDKNFGDKKLEDYPNIKKHFGPYEKLLADAKKKYGTPDKPYFYLHRERNEEFFKPGPKIVCGVRVERPSFFFTKEQYYGSRALNFIKTSRIDLCYLTAILNSQLIYYWLKHKGKQLGDLLQIDKGPLFEIPIFVGDKKEQQAVVNLVTKILELIKELEKLQENSNQWNSIKTEIERTDKKIDEEVYKLYGLTSEEIAVVEGGDKWQAKKLTS